MKIAWRIALILAALFLGSRAVSIGLGDHYLAQARAGDEGKLDAALAWDPANPAARALAAARMAADDPETAASKWSEVLKANPANASAILALGQGTEPEHQDALVQTATTLNAASPALFKRAAAHWLDRGDADRALAAWSDALIADFTERDAIYPILLALLTDARTRGLLAPYAAEPPSWWEHFFRHVTRTAPETETVRALLALRRGPGAAPLSPAEREAYVERLRKDGLATEAYLTWINGLDDTGRRMLGLLNNGSFEAEPTGIGWDWRIRSTKNLLAETAETYGTEGSRALHLVFRGFDDRLGTVVQELFLEPGSYRLSGKARPSGLKTTGGLQWVVDCTRDGRWSRIAESDRFVGSSQWEPFALEFEIPADCTRPVLRLTNAVRISTDKRIDGSIWFDAMRIQRLATEVADAG